MTAMCEAEFFEKDHRSSVGVNGQGFDLTGGEGEEGEKEKEEKGEGCFRHYGGCSDLCETKIEEDVRLACLAWILR